MSIQEMTWLIKQVGSRKRLAKKLGVDVSMISKIINGEPISMSLALEIESLSKGVVSAERLLKERGKFKDAKLLADLRKRSQEAVVSTKDKPFRVKVSLSAIEKEWGLPLSIDYPIIPSDELRPILINEEQQLLFGRQQLQWFQAQGHKKIEALVVNLAQLIESGKPLTEPGGLMLLENLAVGLALEVKIKELKKAQRFLKKGKKMTFSCRNCDKKSPRNDEIIAKLCGIRSKDSYRRAKFTVKKGIPDLLRAMNEGRVSIYRASEIARHPGEQQHAILTDFLQQHKKRR